MIPYSKQLVTSKDIKAVNKVLKSNFLTQGPVVETLRINFQNIVIQNLVLQLIVQQVVFIYRAQVIRLKKK